jgi:DNA-binding IclR family transcriptional regulator
MSIDTMVLGAMLRLARRRKAADVGEVAVRAGCSPAGVRASLRRLDSRGLVERRLSQPPRLTLAGLAVAVACLPRRPVRAVADPARQSTSRAA